MFYSQFVFFLSCKDPSKKLLEAESLHQKGEIKEAIRAYNETIAENHSLSSVKQANEQLQNIYIDYSKKLENSHPEYLYDNLQTVYQIAPYKALKLLWNEYYFL